MLSILVYVLIFKKIHKNSMLSDHSFHCISRWSIDPKICQIKMGFHTRQTAFFAFKLYKRQIFLGYNFWKANFILRNSTIHSYQIIGFHVFHTIQILLQQHKLSITVSLPLVIKPNIFCWSVFSQIIQIYADEMIYAKVVAHP